MTVPVSENPPPEGFGFGDSAKASACNKGSSAEPPSVWAAALQPASGENPSLFFFMIVKPEVE